MKEFGPKWVRVAERVPNRTDGQCRERWKNLLDPTLSTADWTEGPCTAANFDRVYSGLHTPWMWSVVQCHTQLCLLYFQSICGGYCGANEEIVLQRRI